MVRVKELIITENKRINNNREKKIRVLRKYTIGVLI